MEKKCKQPAKRVMTAESSRQFENQMTAMENLEQEMSTGDVQDEGPPSKKQCLEENEETNSMTS